MKTLQALVAPAALLGLSQLLSRGLGVLRDHMLARTFGVEGIGAYSLDAYTVAFRVPDLLYTLVAAGILGAALVPYLIEHKKKQDEIIISMAVGVGLTLGLGSLALYSFSDALAVGLAPGLGPMELATLSGNIKVQAITPLFFGLSAIAMAVGQVHKVALWFALAPLVYNAAIIVAIYFFGAGYGVVAASYGVVVGAALHGLVQLPTLSGLRLAMPRIAHILHVAAVGLPRAASLLLQQGQWLVLLHAASLGSTGTLAVLSFAFNIISLPLGVVGLSVAYVSFADLVKAKQQKKAEIVKERTSQMLLWLIPMAVGLFAFREPIVAVVLTAGAFSLEQAHRVAESVMLLAAASIPLALIPFWKTIFFSEKRIWVALIASMAGLIVMAAVNQILPTTDSGIAARMMAGAFTVLAVLFIFFKSSLKKAVLMGGALALFPATCVSAALWLLSMAPASGFWPSLFLLTVSSLVAVGLICMFQPRILK